MLIELTTNDIFEAEKLVKKMVELSPINALKYNKDKTLLTIHDFINSIDKCALGYKYKGKLVGLFGGSLIKYFTSDDMVACENMWFVLEEYRTKTRAAYTLLKAFIKWAEDSKAVIILSGVSSSKEFMIPTAKMYNKVGFNTTGYTFTKQLI